MKNNIILALFTSCISVVTIAQQPGITLSSSNKELEKRFNWAKQMALSYNGKPSDPVGPWYESALPPRSAFCMRDVAHQSIGGEILSLSAQNKNMFTLFAKNISESKDWCSYWEMNASGGPAPEDYRNDKEFWYNLNANFDILSASWRMYLWTGDKTYINDPTFLNFHQKSVDDYIERWILQVDSLLTRPGYVNVPQPFNIRDAFHRARGLPSYSEGVPDLRIGVDLIAAISSGLESYASILQLQKKGAQAKKYESKAKAYREHIDRYWWDDAASQYNTHLTNDGKYGKGEGETFLLWFDALTDTVRTRKTIEHLTSKNWNVENLSYFPYLLYKYGYSGKAREYIFHLTDSAKKRREYPEVSFGVIEGFVQGMMGVDADARYSRISTVYNGDEEEIVAIRDVPVLSTLINLEHSKNKSTIENKGQTDFTWRVKFNGRHPALSVNGKRVKAKFEKDRLGRTISYADVKIKSGSTAIAFVK